MILRNGKHIVVTWHPNVVLYSHRVPYRIGQDVFFSLFLLPIFPLYLPQVSHLNVSLDNVPTLVVVRPTLHRTPHANNAYTINQCVYYTVHCTYSVSVLVNPPSIHPCKRLIRVYEIYTFYTRGAIGAGMGEEKKNNRKITMRYLMFRWIVAKF
jgi:hypothetical protein